MIISHFFRFIDTKINEFLNFQKYAEIPLILLRAKPLSEKYFHLRKF